MKKLCVLLLCFCSFVRGDSVLDSIHLKALLQNVRENPLIEARNMESKALRLKKKALFAEYLPKVALGYAYQNTLNPDIFYPERVDGMFLEAQWLLFDGLKREGKLEIADYKIKAKEAEAKSTKDKLELKIIQEYFNALSVEGKLNALKHQQKELEESIAKYEKFYGVGLATLGTLEAIKAQSYQNSYAIESLKLAYKVHLEQLSLLSGVQVVSLNANAKLQEVSLETKKQQREDLQANFYALKARESAKSQYTYLPQIALTNRYTRYNSHNRNIPLLPFAIPFSDPSHQNMFGISISFTLFDSLATLRARESARLNALAENLEYAYLKDSQDKELIIAKEALKSAKEKITWAKSGVKSSSIAYSYAKEKFNAQLIDYTQYLNALSSLLNAQSFYDEARFLYEIKKAEFLYKNGNALVEFIKD
ncbi:TolC family protein [Helicobacter sp.]|uniref:TolC family protein n=1 Tax=Helicobacter sp. TaxID=218 RepID=UPI0025C3FA15|nr:TolC family protein [Helicobacter sp.]MCI5968120.1 TolC family protein [Helicobacter sp.]